jgi:hypothetical protein
MKKLFLAAVMAAALFACSDDSDSTTNSGGNNNNPENPQNPENPENPVTLATLNGTWKLTSFTSTQAFDLNNDGTSSADVISESGCYNNSKIIFGQNSHATFIIQLLDVGLAVVNNQNLNFTTACESGTSEDYFYTSTDTSVSFTINDGIENEPIVFTRSGNTLTATFPEILAIPYAGSVNDYDYHFYGGTIVFTKLQ